MSIALNNTEKEIIMFIIYQNDEMPGLVSTNYEILADDEVIYESGFDEEHRNYKKIYTVAPDDKDVKVRLTRKLKGGNEVVKEVPLKFTPGKVTEYDFAGVDPQINIEHDGTRYIVTSSLAVGPNYRICGKIEIDRESIDYVRSWDSKNLYINLDVYKRRRQYSPVNVVFWLEDSENGDIATKMTKPMLLERIAPLIQFKLNRVMVYGIVESVDKYSYMDIYHFNALDEFDNYIERVYAEYHEDYDGGKYVLILPSKYIRKGAKYSLVINIEHKEYRRTFEVNDYSPSTIDARTGETSMITGLYSEMDEAFIKPTIRFNYSESNIIFDLANKRIVVERKVYKKAYYNKINEDIFIPITDEQMSRLPERIDTIITFADYKFITIHEDEMRLYDATFRVLDTKQIDRRYKVTNDRIFDTINNKMYYKHRNEIIEQDLDMGGMLPLGIIDGLIIFYRKDITGDDYNYIRMYEIGTDTWSIVGRRLNDIDNISYSFVGPDNIIYILADGKYYAYDFRIARLHEMITYMERDQNLDKVICTSNKLLTVFEDGWYALIDATL